MLQGGGGVVRPLQGIFSQSSQKKGDLGYIIAFDDGRAFRYCKAGEAITKGQIVEAPAVDTTNDKDLVIAVAGKTEDREIQLTIPSAHASFDANAYENGFVIIETGTEKGHIRKIRSNESFTTGADATVKFKLIDKLDKSIAISGHYAQILACRANGVLIADEGDADLVGFAVRDVTSGYYFWAQIWGEGVGLNDDSAALASGTVVTNSSGSLVKVSNAYDPVVGRISGYAADSVDAVPLYILLG